jgi:DNA polymerase III subunit gamma/tau
MAYTALARSWRPKNFQELVGQEHVRRSLVNALESGRVHHAFLFTGTRGVGKTTIARILAKCLNCERGVTAEPCGSCAACREIDSGRFVDLIEVDAASRTKVDDTRELLDNVQYSPARGRYKVYLIDEVHMLSTHSFNALLKTLEEPPPHVKFLLATTDPQKLPVTVLSRCLQFNLKRLPVALIAERMRGILEQEKLESEPAGLRLIAQAADGSMRDGLSLLDQLLAFGGGRAGEAEARAMLGSISRDHVVRLAELLAQLDVRGLMEHARALEEWAPDYAQVLEELAGLLVRIAARQAVPDFEGDEVYAPEVIAQLAAALSAEDVQLFYQTAIIGRRDLALAPSPEAGFRMTLLRMVAFRPESEGGQVSAGVAPASPPVRPAALATAAAPGTATGAAPGAAAARAAALGGSRNRAGSTPPGPSSSEARSASVAPPTAVVSDVGGPTESWQAILAKLDLQGAARQLAKECVLQGREAGVVRLALDARSRNLRTQTLEEKLAQALSRYFGQPVRLEFSLVSGALETPAQVERRASAQDLDAARQAFEADPGVQGLRERFGATVLPDTVRPVK